MFSVISVLCLSSFCPAVCIYVQVLLLSFSLLISSNLQPEPYSQLSRGEYTQTQGLQTHAHLHLFLPQVRTHMHSSLSTMSSHSAIPFPADDGWSARRFSSSSHLQGIWGPVQLEGEALTLDRSAHIKLPINSPPGWQALRQSLISRGVPKRKDVVKESGLACKCSIQMSSLIGFQQLFQSAETERGVMMCLPSSPTHKYLVKRFHLLRWRSVRRSSKQTSHLFSFFCFVKQSLRDLVMCFIAGRCRQV